MLIRAHVPLAPLTSLGLGGPAARLCEVTTESDVREASALAGNSDLLVLGGGTNVVVADEGFPGLVLSMRSRGIDLRRTARHDRPDRRRSPGGREPHGRRHSRERAAAPNDQGPTPNDNIADQLNREELQQLGTTGDGSASGSSRTR